MTIQEDLRSIIDESKSWVNEKGPPGASVRHDGAYYIMVQKQRISPDIRPDYIILLYLFQIERVSLLHIWHLETQQYTMMDLLTI